jgi:membrane associated rhomboid family serine protease
MALRIKYNAPVALNFSLICVAVYLIDLFTPMNLTPFFSVGSNIQLSNPVSVLGVLTHIFGHVSLEHLIGNLTFILLLGPIVEEKYGSKNLMTMILITAFVTGMLNVLLFSTGLIGASGIVFMLILLVSFTNVSRGEIPVSFIFIAFLFIGKEVLQSFSDDQISQFAHIIGGVCGSFFGFKSRG